MEEIKRQIEEILAILDEDQYPELYSFLCEEACEYPEDLDLMDIVYQLQVWSPLPDILKDFLIELLETAIRDGNDEAMNDLGAMYYAGEGCEQSFEKAVYYYKMAAERGNRQAQENLGYCYYYGRNMPVDYEKAFHYFALGAFDGHMPSLYKIGDMYANGYYVEKNEKEAFAIYSHCLDIMTEETSKYAGGPVYLRVGDALLNGKGVDVNAEKALICYQRAEVLLYEMVKSGDAMYKKSLAAAVEGQAKAREKMALALPKKEWRFD